MQRRGGLALSLSISLCVRKAVAKITFFHNVIDASSCIHIVSIVYMCHNASGIILWAKTKISEVMFTFSLLWLCSTRQTLYMQITRYNKNVKHFDWMCICFFFLSSSGCLGVHSLRFRAQIDLLRDDIYIRTKCYTRC